MYRPSLADRLRFLAGLPLSLIYVPIMCLTALAYALMPRSLFARLQEQNRASEIAARLSAMAGIARPDELVLDVGAGRGDFLKAIGPALGVRTVGFDIIDYSDDDIDIGLFDGKSIPLDDNSVDIAMAAFVLHHSRDQAGILREMQRVTRRRIVIFEDTYFTPWQYLFTVWNDYYANIVMGSIKALRDQGKLAIVAMPMPLTFRRVSGWEACFREQGLTVLSTAVRHARIKPMAKVTFVLGVPGGDQLA
jgi:SAM-dependent methyltransferase